MNAADAFVVLVFIAGVGVLYVGFPLMLIKWWNTQRPR